MEEWQLLAEEEIKNTQQLQWNNEKAFLAQAPWLCELIPDLILCRIEVLSSLAANHNTPVVILQKLVNSKDRSVRNSLAYNPNTPSDILQELAVDKYEAVLSHPNTPIDLREKIAVMMAGSPNRWTRRHLSENHHAPAATLQQLASDECKWIRLNVARNPNTPAIALEDLATDEDDEVCSAVVFNPNTPISLLKQLAIYQNSKVRGAVAMRSDTPVTILEQLAQDKDIDVYWRVVSNPNTPIRLLIQAFKKHNRGVYYTQDDIVCYGLASNPNTPSDILRELASHYDSRIRAVVASNPSTPATILQQLADEKSSFSYGVDHGLLNHPNLPIAVLEKLAKHSSWETRFSIALYSSTPVTILEQLSNDEHEQVSHCALDRLKSKPKNIISDPDYSLEQKKAVFNSLADVIQPCLERLTVFLSNYAEESVLQKNYSSLSWLERYAIAQNSNTPNNVLRNLAKDSHIIVCAGAKANLESRQELE